MKWLWFYFFIICSFAEAKGLKGQFKKLTKGISVKNVQNATIKAAYFDPVIEVNTNRGSFSTSISFPVPLNFLGYKSLSMGYNNNNPQNNGLGVGWGWSLPFIDNSEKISGEEKFQVSGPWDNSEIVEVDEDLNSLAPEIKKIVSHFKINVSSYKLVPYRAIIDGNFNLYIRLKEESNQNSFWLGFGLNGQRFLFGRRGEPLYLFQPRFHAISWSWENGLLSEISERDLNNLGKKNWALKINYKEKKQKYKKWTRHGFFKMPVGLKDIVITHSESLSMNKENIKSQTFNFDYLDDYLIRSYLEGGVFPKFQAFYERLDKIEKTKKNDLNEKDRRSYIYKESLNNPVVVTSKKDSEEHVIYQDLNSDGRTDKIVITNYKKYNDKIVEIIKKQHKKENVKTLPKSYETKISKDSIKKEIDKEKMNFKVFMGIFSEKTNKFNYVEDPSLDLNSFNFLLSKFTIKKHVQKDKNTNNLPYHYVKVSPSPNGLNFIDLNNDGRKDLIFCEGELEEEDNSVVRKVEKEPLKPGENEQKENKFYYPNIFKFFTFDFFMVK